jgi:hypothetical protein
MRWSVRRRIDERGESSLRLHFDRVGFEVVASIPLRLRQLFTGEERSSPLIQRLFPPAHTDEDLQREHEELLGEMLFERRLASLQAFEETVARAETTGRRRRLDLSPPEIDLWLHVINDMRIVLGVRLGIRNNSWHDSIPNDPQEKKDHFLLGALSVLQEEMLGALGEAEF